MGRGANNFIGEGAQYCQVNVTSSFALANEPGEVHGKIHYRTEDQMKKKATYDDEGWKFGEIWSIDDGVSYPTLQWQKNKSSSTFSDRLEAGDLYL